MSMFYRTFYIHSCVRLRMMYFHLSSTVYNGITICLFITLKIKMNRMIGVSFDSNCQKLHFVKSIKTFCLIWFKFPVYILVQNDMKSNLLNEEMGLRFCFYINAIYSFKCNAYFKIYRILCYVFATKLTKLCSKALRFWD